MKDVRLNNGVMMPAIGFGVFQIPENETEHIVNSAIEVGYRLFDTASSYFNEEQVGNAIRRSGVKREDFFVTTKLWVQDYEYDNALRAFELSMKKLGLDYLDLYLMHKPYGNYYAAWRAMERLYKEGRIRAIGVTSFPNERLQDLFLHNEVKPVVNQLETHPFVQQQDAHAFLQQEGIQHEAWAPFAEGQNDIFNHPMLKEIALRHGKSVGAIILRWLNQRNIVVIPKSVHKERMIENFNILDPQRLLQPFEQRVFCIPAVGVRVCAHCRLARYTKEQRQCLCGRHKEDTSSHNHHDGLFDILFFVVHLDIHTDSTYNRHHTGNSVTQFDHIRHILGNFRRHSPKGCRTGGIVTCRILSDWSRRSDKQHERHHFDSLGRANALHDFLDFLKHFLTLIINTRFYSSAQSSVFISDTQRRKEIRWRHRS